MTTETATMGRSDYGWGVTVELVTIEGDQFATHEGKYYSECGHCSPAWSGSKSHFGHVLSGVCFQCGGRGWFKVYADHAAVVKLVKGRRTRAAAAERKAARKAAEAEAAQVAWATAHPVLAARLAEVVASEPPVNQWGDPEDWDAYRAYREKWGEFVLSLAARASFGPLTDAQTEAVADALDRVEARAAAVEAKVAASRYFGEVGAKVTGTGTVVVRATYESQYGMGAVVVVEGTGDFEGVTFKTSGTGKTLWEVARGDQVEVTGAVKDHADYKDVRQTVLTRAAFTVVEAAEAD